MALLPGILFGVILAVLPLAADAQHTMSAQLQAIQPLELAWTSDVEAPVLAVAWGDYDGDGDPDLALGGVTTADFGGIVIYRNDNGQLADAPTWTAAETSGQITSLAWSDYDNDGDQDLVAGMFDAPNRLYRNDRNNGGTLPTTATWLSSEADRTNSVAWADYDGDGDEDLAVGNGYKDFPEPNRLYHNDGGTLTAVAVWSASVEDETNALAWADYDSDGDPDLAAGNNNFNVLYRNDGEDNFTVTSDWPTMEDNFTFSLDWGDFDSDGDPDLALGNDGLNALYVNDAAILEQSSPLGAWPSNDKDFTTGIVWVDYDNDGDLDVFEGNFDAPSRLYRNDDGGSFVLAWSTPESYDAAGVDWADYDGDGDLDLALANSDQESVVYVNTSVSQRSAISVTLNEQPIQGAMLFRKRAGGEAFDPYTDADGRVIRSDASGQLPNNGSIAAGDVLVAMYPEAETKSYTGTNVPQAIRADRETVVTSTLTVADQGFVRDVNVVNLNGQHTWFSDLSFALISPANTRIQIMASSCADEDNFDLSLDDDAPDAWPCPPTGGGTYKPTSPLSAFNNEPSAGTWTLVITDSYALDGGSLDGWGLQIAIADSSAPLYYTNARPIATGVEATTVANLNDPINIEADQPLLIFDLDVSLEWDARNNASYMDQLRFDLERTSELLYDFSDGQAALGTINIYHNQERWQAADVRLFATNRLRPNASKGGIVTSPLDDPQRENLSYVPGEVRIGSVWNRFGDATGAQGEDWPRSLAHELSHYLLFLEDNYIGLKDGQLIGLPETAGGQPCPGAMTDPYLDSYTEYHPPAGWLPNCALTLSNVAAGRSDWETIRLFYPQLNAPTTFNANPGPSFLPLPVTSIVEHQPTRPPQTLEAPVINLVSSDGGRVVPGASARAFLFQGDRLIDEGHPVLDQVEARGARPGDRLCVFELDRRRLGCIDQMSEQTTELTLAAAPAWRPDVRIDPQTLTSFVATVAVDGTGMPPSRLFARFYPIGGAASAVTPLTRQGDVYRGALTTTQNIEEGHLHVWVDEPVPRREIVTDYTQISPYRETDAAQTLAAAPGDPAITQFCRPPRVCRRSAPTASTDGQALIYGDTLVTSEEFFYALQSATALPPAPAWTTPVGKGYWLTTSGESNALDTASINISYLEREIPAGTEGGIAIYYRGADQRWQRLETTRFDPTRNEVTAKLAGKGLYVALTSVDVRAGWNLFSYPWQERAPVADGLALLNADADDYTTIYGYDADRDAWQLYDAGAAADPFWSRYVNTLAELRYGEGYWISVVNPNPGVSTAARANRSQAAPTSGTPAPPATYYSLLLPSPGFVPAAGQTLAAWVDDRQCAVTTTQSDGNRVFFVVNVPADDGAAYAGCGAPGRKVFFLLDGARLPFDSVWSNVGPQAFIGQQIYLPIVKADS